MGTAHRHQKLVRQRDRHGPHIGRRDGLAGDVHAGSQIRACQAGMGIATVQDRIGLARLGDTSGHGGIRSQEQSRNHHGPHEIILRMLHCNTPRYVVTAAPKHGNNQPIKER
jgi:hypothetical protein